MTSKRRLRKKMCTGKVKHRSPMMAQIAIRKMNPTARYSTYWCRFCGYVHVGHTPSPKVSRKNRRRKTIGFVMSFSINN